MNRQAAGSPPWHMCYRVTETVLPADGQWHTITIPLQDMKESGAWADGWHNPEGKFNWGKIESLDFSWENNYGLECDIWFDAIEIANKN